MTRFPPAPPPSGRQDSRLDPDEVRRILDEMRETLLTIKRKQC